jgi:hypothetical protein
MKYKGGREKKKNESKLNNRKGKECKEEGEKEQKFKHLNIQKKTPKMCK